MGHFPGPSHTDDIYPDGIKFSEVLFDEMDQYGTSWTDIDWAQETSDDAPEKKALIRVATQFQYGNMANLILCGKLLKAEVTGVTMDIQKLSLTLAAYKLDGINAWGRYVKKHGGGEKISPELPRYYQQVFSKDDALSVLLGLGTVAGPFALFVYQHSTGKGDPLFNQVTKQAIKQKEHELALLTTYLKQIVQSDAEQPSDELVKTAKKYQNNVLRILKTNSGPINHLDLDKNNLHQSVQEEIEKFFRDVGLPATQ